MTHLLHQEEKVETRATKKRNPIAKILRDRRYRQLMIKNKKLYNRRKKLQDLETEPSEVN